MRVTKTYFMVYVADMDRAARFYRDAFGLVERSASESWTELGADGAIVALHAGRTGAPSDIGLGFEVDDLEGACDRAVRAGGAIVRPPEERPGEPIRLAIVADPEGNRFSIAQPVRSA
jgi:predicted enzyme related to lactoylglutathione lyase